LSGGTLQGPSPSADPTERGHRRDPKLIDSDLSSAVLDLNGSEGWIAGLPALPGLRCSKSGRDRFPDATRRLVDISDFGWAGWLLQDPADMGVREKVELHNPSAFCTLRAGLTDRPANIGG